MIKRSFSGAFFVGLAATGALVACSAGSGTGPANGSTSQGGFTGGGAQGGDTSGGGFNPGGGDTTTNFGTAGTAGTKGTAGAGGQGPVKDGHIGPNTINRGGGADGMAPCADNAKFASPAGGGKLLYPYDGTIFPRGLAGPLLMWDAPADQILIEAKSSKFTYVDCPKTPDKVRFQIPKDVWDGAGSWSDGTGDPLVMKITLLSGGKATGPINVNLLFALATLKGAIYYNSYQSTLAKNNGAVLKLLPGQASPTLFLTDTGLAPFGPCRSCHALSANGLMMTANHHAYPGLNPATSYISESYDVAGPTPTLIKAGLPEAGFAGIYIDGSRLITNGPPNVSLSAFFPTAPGNVTALVQGTSKMLDAKTGADITPPSWTAQHAQMPMFSPDGKHIVYNDSDKGTGKGHTLFVADYDYASNVFSNPKQIFDDPSVFAAWPFFTPDSKQVIFATDTRSDFASQVPDILGPPAMTPTGRGHLVVIDVATATATKMDLANGYKGGQSYLPAGEARDNNLEFFPTVSPFSAGGFFWSLFTSRRTYGNVLTLPLEDPNTKKIWVTAISIDTPPGQDPSHPPFVLPGQEIEVGNIRAFAALEPCKEDGQPCSAGSDCCKGYCSEIMGKWTCGKIEINQCARMYDKCATDADCCTGPDNGANGVKLYCLGLQCDVKLAR